MRVQATVFLAAAAMMGLTAAASAQQAKSAVRWDNSSVQRSTWNSGYGYGPGYRLDQRGYVVPAASLRPFGGVLLVGVGF